MSLRGIDGRALVALGSLVMSRRSARALVFLSLSAVALGILSLSQGGTALSLYTALTDPDALTESQRFALMELRLPRVVLGFLAGACVAVSGAILQTLARNPLADPGLLGLSQGAMVAILLAMIVWPGLPGGFVPLVALGGALSVALFVLLLTRNSAAGGIALLLMGLAVDSCLTGVTALLLLYTPPEQSLNLSTWLAGSLFSADWPTIVQMLPWLGLAGGLLLLTGAALSVYDLGPALAVALGENTARSYPVLLLAAVGLSAVALTAVGPLMFLGVMAPHIAAALAPETGRIRLLLAGLTGGVLTLAADLVTRTMSSDMALPVGLTLVIIGAPLVIVTLRLRRLHTSL